jgi:exo-beta-1,3-glucanase (GH17 family)
VPIIHRNQSRPLTACGVLAAALVFASACSSAQTTPPNNAGATAGVPGSTGGQGQGGAAKGGGGGSTMSASGGDAGSGAAGSPGTGGLPAAGTGGSLATGGSDSMGGSAGAPSGPKYFKGICYEGYRDGQFPGGPEPTCDQVQQDLSLIASFTRGIRTYGSSSNNHDGKCVPGIADTLGLELHMGVWIDETYGDVTNFGAIDNALITVCGPAGAGSIGCPTGASVHPSIKSVLVGNEYLLRVQEAKGDLVLAEKHLVSYIQYARARLPKSIEVDTSESYPLWLSASAALFQAVDNIVWQAHPFWEGQPIATAAATFAATHDKVVAKMTQYGITKPERCGETGWPWGGTSGQAVGSPANQAQYFKELNAYATKTGLQIWVFESFDENWKATPEHSGASEGAVGAEWGFWTADRAAAPHAVVANIATLFSPNQ